MPNDKDDHQGDKKDATLEDVWDDFWKYVKNYGSGAQPGSELWTISPDGINPVGNAHHGGLPGEDDKYIPPIYTGKHVDTSSGGAPPTLGKFVEFSGGAPGWLETPGGYEGAPGSYGDSEGDASGYGGAPRHYGNSGNRGGSSLGNYPGSGKRDGMGFDGVADGAIGSENSGRGGVDQFLKWLQAVDAWVAQI